MATNQCDCLVQIEPVTGRLDFNIGLELLAERGDVVDFATERERAEHSAHYVGTGEQAGAGVGEQAVAGEQAGAGGYLEMRSPGRGPSVRYTREPGGGGVAEERAGLLHSTSRASTGSRLSAQSGPGWRSNIRGDYSRSDQLRPVCTKDLLCWAHQVARGMQYLASKRVMHGDLACRNILLAQDNVVKICDFGLAKDIMNNNYQKSTDGPLPVKWLAVECIRHYIYFVVPCYFTLLF